MYQSAHIQVASWANELPKRVSCSRICCSRRAQSAETPRGLAFSKKLSRKQRKILLLAALRLRQK
jgi:hypothetical protein